ncbi:MAG TPA: hypothetical protein VFB50_22155 [Chloroflexota bacterium]|nr:hypothetical protein [Chloroflexota bacterium]
MASEVERLRAGARSLALIDAARERRAGRQVTEHPPFELGQLLEDLNTHGVRYVVIGGVAMRFYDASRLTDDLDICYERSRDNCRALARALVELDTHQRVPGAADEPLNKSRLVRATAIFFMLTTRLGWLDLLPIPNGTQGFDDLVQDADHYDLDGIPISVASREALARMKRATGRPVDQKDLLWLESSHD